MSAGRPPKPTNLHVLHGNPGKRAGRSKLESTATPKTLRTPAWLSETAKAAWADLSTHLINMRVVTEADRKALELLCDAYAEYRDARKTLAAEGSTYKTTTPTGDTMYRKRPEVEIANQAWARVHRMMVEFGLTPSSRSKVSKGEEAEADPLRDLLNS